MPEGFTANVRIRTTQRGDRAEIKNDKGEVVSSLELRKREVDGDTYWSGGSGQTHPDYKDKKLMQNLLKLTMEKLPT